VHRERFFINPQEHPWKALHRPNH